MLESYIRTGDGKDYVDVDCVREALGIIDEDINIFGVIKKLREDKDLLEELHTNHIGQLKEYAELASELGIGSGDAESIKDYIVSLKEERDQLKEKCDKLKLRANAMYGASCGYSADKAPAFRCNVISYSWNFGPIASRLLMDEPSCILNNDSIRVELDLTPNANYKGTFDMEDLKRYIEEYGREKRLGVLESVDYQKAKAARAELAFLYKTVLGKDRLDTNLSPHEVMKAIHDEYKRVAGHDKLFRDSVCDALGTTTAVSDSYLFKNIEKLKLDHKEIQEKYSRYCLAVGSLCNIPAEHREDISWIEDAFNSTKKDALKWKDDADRLARLRSNICTALCLGHESCDGNIIGRIHMLQDCHDKLCKDYTDLRKAIWEAMDRKPETLPNETARLVGEVHALAYGNKWLRGFRDGVAEAIGITYHTTNNFIFKRVSDIYKECGEAHDLAMELDRKCMDLTAKNSELESKWKEQYCLRQQWHVRYESEHERANGVQKALDREREKCRIKDISLETTKKQYEKVCGNLETAECALNGMRSKVRELREENALLKKEVAELKGDETEEGVEE